MWPKMSNSTPFDDVLRRMAAIHQAKDADYGSSYNLAPALRPAPGKDAARVFDYLDPVGVLENAARVRQRVYKQP